MSTGLGCHFTEQKDGSWVYELESSFGCECYNTYGPFTSYEKAEDHLCKNHANPGGWTIKRRK